ncbi:hypothetical protein OENI_470017 [Oenococcus oeni]|nr:hypothetical protein OENI_470017 [Oenococcus oeni]SYW09290.1 hypothetical protein OENI_70052 [Oenococcus oeni]SYW13493.1 hypothetical protein OENI_1240021 [Oenococcus oeni]SYW17844.1 hypothetical protein OENI_130033 [Oenococcus oeni]
MIYTNSYLFKAGLKEKLKDYIIFLLQALYLTLSLVLLFKKH